MMQDSIVFIDEGNSFVMSDAFADAIQNTDNYYVIVTREGIPSLSYSGDTVKITKMYCKGINTWFFVQKGNKSGWMKSAMKQPPYADYYFYGAYYAG